MSLLNGRGPRDAGVGDVRVWVLVGLRVCVRVFGTTHHPRGSSSLLQLLQQPQRCLWAF